MEDFLEIDKRSSLTICVSETNKQKIRATKCSNAFIYVLNRVQLVEIEECDDCAIFLCYSGEILMKNSRRSKISAYCGKISIRGCKNINLSLFSQTKPLISDHSSSVTISPFDAIFKGIVPEGKNFWDSPDITEDSAFQILPPEEFIPFVVPFGDEPDGICSPLPKDYLNALKTRQIAAEERKQIVLHFQQKHPVYSQRIQKKISSAFAESLNNSISGKQIQNLGNIMYL